MSTEAHSPLADNRDQRLAAALDAATRLDSALDDGTGRRGPRRKRSRSEVEEAAAEFLARLDDLDDRDLVSLDRRVRSWSEYLHWGHGRHLARGFVADHPSTVQSSAAAASFAVDGFKREQACRALGGFIPWSLRLLVIRTTDWVEQVRAAALETVARASAADLAAHIGLVERLARDRLRNADLERLVESLRNSDAGVAALADVRGAPDPLARRTAWQLLMRWSPAPTRTDLAEAARDPDPWLRHWALREAEAAGRVQALQVANRLRSDRIGRLRARALSTQISLGAVDRATLLAALSDPSMAVRSLAQFHLREDADLADYYRVRLSGEPQAADILGLGEVGSSCDAEIVSAWLTDLRPRYRRAALAAYARLAKTEALAAAAELVNDPSPRVAAAATRLLATSTLPETLIVQSETLAATGPASARRRAVVVLRRYPWRWLLATLHCLDEPDGETSAFVREELALWLRRSATVTIAPPAHVAEEIAGRLTTVEPASAESIRFALRTSAPGR